MRGRRARTAVLGLSTVLLLWLPAAARAATVEVWESPSPLPGAPAPGPGPGPSVLYTLHVIDRLGEPNTLELDVAEGTARVRAARGELHAGDGCHLDDAHTVTCVRPRFNDVRLETGPGADRITASSDELVLAELGRGDDVFELRGGRTSAWVGAGTGDDRVSGAAGPDSLKGQGGHDTLRGRGGRDELDDGDATHTPNRDVLDGGRGVDLAYYDRRTAGVVIDLARVNGQGERGENDAVIGVEEVRSGSGKDVLRGDGADNFLDAGLGRRGDVVVGRGGDDYIWYAKRVVAGPGRDVVIYGERGGRVSCGDGLDDVMDMARRVPSELAADCERIGLIGEEGNYRSLLPPASPSAPVGRLRAECGRQGPCRYELTITALASPRGRVIGRKRATLPRERGRTLRLRLSRRGRELLAERRRLHVLVTVRAVEPKTSLFPRRVRRESFRTVLRV